MCSGEASSTHAGSSGKRRAVLDAKVRILGNLLCEKGETGVKNVGGNASVGGTPPNLFEKSKTLPPE